MDTKTDKPQNGNPDTGRSKSEMQQEIINVLQTCYDPEIPVSIYELGLIYDVAIDDDNNITIKMTLTTPACPVAGSLPIEVDNKIRGVAGVKDVRVDVVWDPPWNPNMMSEAAKLTLNMF